METCDKLFEQYKKTLNSSIKCNSNKYSSYTQSTKPSNETQYSINCTLISLVGEINKCYEITKTNPIDYSSKHKLKAIEVKTKMTIDSEGRPLDSESVFYRSTEYIIK